MKQLLENIATNISISSNLKEDIINSFKKEELPPKTHLLKDLQYCKKLFFLEKGTVRTYYYHNGNDITSWFYPENQFFTAWYSFYSQEASFENIQTMEDCVLYSIGYESYQKLLTEHHQFEKFGRLLAEEQTAFIDYYSKGYMFLSAKERYDLILTYFPDIELRVKLGHIASFLGISQETLSRIRSKK